MRLTRFIYIIDSKPSNRKYYSKIIDETLNFQIIKNFFASVKEAIELLESDFIAAPDYIFVAHNAIDSQSHTLLHAFRLTTKGNKVKIVLFGPSTTTGLYENARNYDGRILELQSYQNLQLEEITDSVRRLYN